jgi:hypothetical protein
VFPREKAVMSSTADDRPWPPAPRIVVDESRGAVRAWVLEGIGMMDRLRAAAAVLRSLDNRDDAEELDVLGDDFQIALARFRRLLR